MILLVRTVAYARSWRLALALTSIFPCIAISGSLMAYTVSKYTKLSLSHAGDSATIAEEVISTIRTTQAFGAMGKLAGMYDDHVEKGSAADVKVAVGTGVAMGFFYFL